MKPRALAISARCVLYALSAAAALTVFGCRVDDPEKIREPSYTPLWMFPDGKRYLGLKNESELVAVDLARTAQLWSFEVPRSVTPFALRQHLVCAPLFIDDFILLRGEEFLVVLDASTGRLRRREQVEQTSQFGSRVCPSPAGDGTFVAVVDSGTRLRRARVDGSELWSVRLPEGVVAAASPRRTQAGDVVVRARDRIVTFAADGSLKWSRSLEGYID